MMRKGAPITRILLGSACIALAAGCYFVSFEDVSRQQSFSRYIGKTYFSSAASVIHGVTMDRNYAPNLDHYIIQRLPGFSGPEVLSRATLPLGTGIQVLRVERCTNCLFEDRLTVVVGLTTTQAFDAAEVRLLLSYITSESPLFQAQEQQIIPKALSNKALQSDVE